MCRSTYVKEIDISPFQNFLALDLPPFTAIMAAGRACRRPTARKVIDLFEDVQRYELSAGKRPTVLFTTKLTRLQRQILRLPGMPKGYGG